MTDSMNMGIDYICDSKKAVAKSRESADPELRRRIKNDMSNLLSNMNV